MRGSRAHSSEDSHAPDRVTGGVKPVWLDYGAAAKSRKFLANLSAVCVAGKYLWTISDEGRTVECLEPRNGGYRLRHQYRLDDMFPDLPGKATRDEADIESLDADARHIWLSGSHSRVRVEAAGNGGVNVGIRPRRSRHLLGVVALGEGGGALKMASARALPFAGRGSFRRRLREDPYLAPFGELPSKENGLDVEGLAATADRVFFGLRGPLIDNAGVVVEMVRSERAIVRRARPALHFLDLGGVGVRDLARDGATMFVLAGPVASADAPFALFLWRPRYSTRIHEPVRVYDWPVNGEHPEGIAVLERGGRKGLLVIYDGPDERRIDGTRYRADWIALSSLAGVSSRSR
jgi:hypothetical protein